MLTSTQHLHNWVSLFQCRLQACSDSPCIMCLCPISSSTLGSPLLLTLTPENKATRADVASLQSDKDKAITDLKSAANDNLWLAHLLQGKGYKIDVTLFFLMRKQTRPASWRGCNTRPPSTWFKRTRTTLLIHT